MGIPPKALYQIDAEGRFRTASAGLALALHEKIARARYRGRVLSAWCIGDMGDGVLVSSSNAVIGDYLLPPSGSESQTLEIYARIRSYSSGTGSISAQVMRLVDGQPPRGGEPEEIITVSGTGWEGGTLTYNGAKEPRILRLTRDTTASYEIGDVTIMTGVATEGVDGTAAPATWRKQAIAHVGGADRPLDIYSFRTCVEAANQVLCRYPRMLASHSLETKTRTRTSSGTPSSSEIVTAYYKIRRGPRTSDCTLKVRVSQTNVSGAGTSGTVRVYVDGVLYGTTASITAGASESEKTITITGSTFTANTLHEIKVEAFAGYKAANNDSVTVHEIFLTEDAFSEADTFVSSTARLDTIAPKPYSVSGTALASGQPIFARNDLVPRQDRWSDRATMWRTVAHHAQHRVSTLIADRLGKLAVTSTAAKGSAETLARGLSTQTAGASTAECWVLARRGGTADLSKVPRLTITKNGVEQDGASILVTERATERVWRRVGTITVEGDSATDVGVSVGFENAITGVSASSTDSLGIEGFVAWEVIPAPATLAQYFYDSESYTTSNSIPDNDTVTGLSKTISVPASRNFQVARVRVNVVVSHATPTQLAFTLSNSTRSVEFRSAGHAGATSAWWSDSTGGFIGDTTPDNLLSAFIGDDSADTWTLTVTDNAAGTTGTLTGWALELW